MISIDHRTGSKELAPLFLDFGIKAQITTLDYGDFAWEGNGPHGRCAIVLERKVIGDLVDSIQSRRLSGHQMPGMAEQYDYCYLLVEGVWRPGGNGELQMGQGEMTRDSTYGGNWIGSHGRKQLLYRSVDNYLATMELHAGVIYRRTMSPAETVFMIVDLYRWWNDKLWHEHSSHLSVYAPAVVKPGKGRLQLARREASLCEKWAMQLPHIDKRAQLVAEHFGSARVMANATEEEWVAIKGIGKPTAKQVVGEINAHL